MGLEVVVEKASSSVGEAMARLARDGFACALAMIDGQLCMPDAAVPDGWREVRLRTPVGMVTLARVAGGVAVRVMGNADERTRDLQRRLAAALGGE